MWNDYVNCQQIKNKRQIMILPTLVFKYFPYCHKRVRKTVYTD